MRKMVITVMYPVVVIRDLPDKVIVPSNLSDEDRDAILAEADDILNNSTIHPDITRISPASDGAAYTGDKGSGNPIEDIIIPELKGMFKTLQELGPLIDEASEKILKKVKDAAKDKEKK